MTLGELILELASIDNNQNIPSRELMDWPVVISDGQGNRINFLSFYPVEDAEKIVIDVDYEWIK